MTYRIACCGRTEGRATAQALLLAAQLRFMGIKKVEIVPTVFIDKSLGVKPDKTFYDELREHDK